MRISLLAGGFYHIFILSIKTTLFFSRQKENQKPLKGSRHKVTNFGHKIVLCLFTTAVHILLAHLLRYIPKIMQKAAQLHVEKPTSTAPPVTFLTDKMTTRVGKINGNDTERLKRHAF